MGFTEDTRFNVLAFKIAVLNKEVATKAPSEPTLCSKNVIIYNGSVGATQISKLFVMPNTYTQLLTQLVFAVKGRSNLIEETFRERVEKFICVTASNRKHKPLAIYCMPDHLHFLIGLSPDQSISDLVKEIKISSNELINDNRLTKSRFYWQEGYGGFSYSKSALDNVVKYILNQQEHHKKKTFKEEYIEFLEKFGIQYDSKYLFEFY